MTGDNEFMTRACRHNRNLSRQSLLTRSFAAGALILALALGPEPALSADRWVKSISASYRIQLAGVKFGNYNFTSTREGRAYKTNSNAKLRAFFGAFKWRGATRSTGTMTSRGPRPTRYVYNYRRNKKKPRTVSVAMARGNATQVVHTPPRNRSKKRIPITKAHYQDVLDPMSAIMALSAPTGDAEPCRQTVRIFDGSHRFDVRLTPKGRKRIDVKVGTGFSNRALVCRVQHFPIAGHKRGKNSNYISDPKGVEVWLVPAANGLIYVPYRIVVPTLIGSAVLQASSVNVELSDRQRLALQQ